MATLTETTLGKIRKFIADKRNNVADRDDMIVVKQKSDKLAVVVCDGHPEHSNIIFFAFFTNKSLNRLGEEGIPSIDTHNRTDYNIDDKDIIKDMIKQAHKVPFLLY